MTASKKAPNPIDKHVGARVRMRRMMLNMSQEKLGDAIGLTFQQVRKYEKGTNRIGASRLMQIATVLQVEVKFFFEGAPSTSGGTARDEQGKLATEFFTAPGAAALAGAYVRLGTRSRKALLDIADCLQTSEAVVLKKAG